MGKGIKKLKFFTRQLSFSFLFFSFQHNTNEIILLSYTKNYSSALFFFVRHCSFKHPFGYRHMYLHHKICCWVFHQLKSTRTTTGLILPASDKTYRRFCCCLFWCFLFRFSFFSETTFYIKNCLEYLIYAAQIRDSTFEEFVIKWWNWLGCGWIPVVGRYST